KRIATSNARDRVHNDCFIKSPPAPEDTTNPATRQSCTESLESFPWDLTNAVEERRRRASSLEILPSNYPLVNALKKITLWISALAACSLAVEIQRSRGFQTDLCNLHCRIV